jgi:hypothetical protein
MLLFGMCQGKRVGEFNHKGVAYTSALLAGNPSPEHHHLSRYKQHLLYSYSYSYIIICLRIYVCIYTSALLAGNPSPEHHHLSR